MNALATSTILEDELNDSLCDVFGTEHDTQMQELREFYKDFDMDGTLKEQPLPTVEEAPLFVETCKSCRGSGRFVAYTGRVVGPCFKCKGAGKLSFKTSPEDRAANRDGAARRKQTKEEQALTQFASAHPSTYGWMVAASARGFGFAAEMLETLKKWGHLTERQLAAVQRCEAQDAERSAKRAADAIERDRLTTAIDITRIEASMASAIEKGVKRPLLRLDTFRFALKPDLGVIYVRDANDRDVYYGKIEGGKFVPARSATPEIIAKIIEVAADPSAAAKAYGQRTGECSCCGRELTNHASIDLGIGPICAGRFGL